MAVKELKSIKFPGLEDTYVIPEGGSIDIDLANANEGEATPVNADTLGGRSPEEYIALANNYTNQQVKKAAPRNLLDNSDFTNPVNQRGKTSYSGAVYGIDRWRGHIDLTVSVEDGGIVLSAGSGTANLNHIIDDAVSKRLGGKVVTIAVCDNNNVITIASGPLSAEDVSANTSQIVAGSDLGHFYINVYKLKTTQRFEMRINVRAGRSTKLKWVALYEGEYTAETLPEYQPKGYGAELAECQRYYQKLSRIFTTGWLSSGAKNYTIPIQLAVGMRILPTASMSGYIARKHDGYSVHTGSNVTAPENLTVYSLSAFESGLVVLVDSIATNVDTNNIVLAYQLNDVELSADL